MADHPVVVGGESIRSDQMLGYSNISEKQVAQQVATLFDLEKTLDDDALLSLAIDEVNNAALGLIRAGAAFMVLKSRLPHGAYDAAIDARGFSRWRAHEAVRVARMFGILPIADAERFKTAQPSKLVLLAKLGEKDIRAENQAGHLDELLNKSWRDLNEFVKGYATRAVVVRAARDPRVNLSRPSGRSHDPRALTMARDQIIGTLFRARAEIELAQQALILLNAEMPETGRLDVLHFAAAELHAIGGLAAIMRRVCKKHAGDARDVLQPLGELETIKQTALGERSRFAMTAAQADVTDRARRDQSRHGIHGRPPVSMAAVVKQLTDTDVIDDDGE